MLHGIEQCLLLIGDLFLRCQMLKTASTANPEMRAPGFHPVRAGLQDFHQVAFVMFFAFCGIAKQDLFTGQRPVNKCRLPIHMGHAPTIVAK